MGNRNLSTQEAKTGEERSRPAGAREQEHLKTNENPRPTACMFIHISVRLSVFNSSLATRFQALSCKIFKNLRLIYVYVIYVFCLKS